MNKTETQIKSGLIPGSYLAMLKKLELWIGNNRLYFSLVLLVSAFSTWINYSSTTQIFILTYYEKFARLIQEGIYTSDYNQTAGTFPMWGYGFVFAVTKNKLIILAMQQLLNLLVIYLYDGMMQQKLSNKRLLFYYRLLILFSFPIYFFHATRWPYSFNSSFLLLGLYFLARFMENSQSTKAPLTIIASGLFMGIALNFRSDYLLCFGIMVTVICLMYIIKYRKATRHLLYMATWLICIFLMLAPWAIYTKRTVNHYLAGSTNAGHVLYIGLGQLPGNKWQIRPYDDDSTMHRILDSQLYPGIFSTTYAADSVLKKEWLRNVTSSPAEYIRKCLYTAGLVFIQPFAEGDGFKQSFTAEELTFIRENVRNMHFVSLIKFLSGKLSFTLILSIVAALIGLMVHLLFWLNLFRLARRLPSIHLQYAILLPSLVIVFYQFALLTAGYYHRNYNTNIYLLYVVLLFLMIDYRSQWKNNTSAHTGTIQ